MLLHAARYAEGLSTVVSDVTLDGKRVCKFLEDELRGWGQKVYGETCIPEGLYRIDPLHETPMAVRYYERFPWFRGLPGLTWASPGPMAPSYSNLRVHPGTTKKDTLGCPLTATSVVLLGGDFQARDSALAFKAFCLPLYDEWDRVADTYLEISNDRIRL